MSEVFTFFASTFGGTSAFANTMAVTCRINGQPVQCSDFGSFAAAAVLLFIALIVIVIASHWKIYVKAGKPGWTSLIPIYNIVVLLEIIGRPIWWVILFFLPFVNVVMGFVLAYELAKVFGKGIGYTLGFIFLPFIFYPMLAFGGAKYQGNASAAV